MEPTERKLAEAAQADRSRMRAALTRMGALEERVSALRLNTTHTAFVSLPWLFLCILSRFWWGLLIWLGLAFFYVLLVRWQRRIAAMKKLLST